MPADRPHEPWLSFLDDLDRELEAPAELHCMGGFAVIQAYGLARATADIDILAVVPHRVPIYDIAGRGSALHRKHGVYLDFVTVATVPEDYESRLSPLYPGFWSRLRLFVLEAHDLALSKLERNFERDRSDVHHLARSGYLQAATLRSRYVEEMQCIVIGRQSWHDQTLEMWIEAYFSPESP
jgi:hypothetical protein